MRTKAQINLKGIEVFLATLEGGSMTAAAARLGMTQSAVSQLIKQLEMSLGAVLFDRDQRPLVLTAAGQRLLSPGSEILRRAQQISTIIHDYPHERLPQVRMGCIDSFAATFGPELVKSLQSKAHQVSLWSGLAADIREHLLRHELDLIVTTDPFDDLDGYERHALLREPLVLVLPRRTEHAAPRDLAEIAAEMPLIRYSVRSMLGRDIERYLRRRALQIPHRFECDETGALVNLVGAGLGWGITTPLSLLQSRYDPEAIQVLPLPKVTIDRTFYLVAPQHQLGRLPVGVARTVAIIMDKHIGPALHRIAPWRSVASLRCASDKAA